MTAKKRYRVYSSDSERDEVKSNISKIVVWLEEKYGIGVIFDSAGDNCFYYDDFNKDDNFIEINTRQSFCYQLFTLLHEAAHVLIRKNMKDYRKRFSQDYNKRDKFFKVDVLREEVLAWEKAMQIAKQKDIQLNEEKFYKFMRNRLHGYAVWCAKPRSNRL